MPDDVEREEQSLLDELLTSYERVVGHCSNIAAAMVEIAENKLDTHACLGKLKYSSNEANAKFEQRYEKYLDRYALPENQQRKRTRGKAQPYHPVKDKKTPDNDETRRPTYPTRTRRPLFCACKHKTG